MPIIHDDPVQTQIFQSPAWGRQQRTNISNPEWTPHRHCKNNWQAAPVLSWHTSFFMNWYRLCSNAGKFAFGHQKSDGSHGLIADFSNSVIDWAATPQNSGVRQRSPRGDTEFAAMPPVYPLSGRTKSSAGSKSTMRSAKGTQIQRPANWKR